MLFCYISTKTLSDFKLSKLMYIVTFTKRWSIVSASMVQNSHKAVSLILHFKRYLLVEIIRSVKFYH